MQQQTPGGSRLPASTMGKLGGKLRSAVGKQLGAQAAAMASPASIVDFMRKGAQADGSSNVMLDIWPAVKDDWFPRRLYLLDALNRRRREGLSPSGRRPPMEPDNVTKGQLAMLDLAGDWERANELQQEWLWDAFIGMLRKKTNESQSQRLILLRQYRREFYQEVLGQGLGGAWLYQKTCRSSMHRQEEENLTANVMGRGTDGDYPADPKAVAEACMDHFVWAAAMGDLAAVKHFFMEMANPLEAALVGAAVVQSLLDDELRDSAFDPDVSQKGNLEELCEWLNDEAYRLLLRFERTNGGLLLKVLQQLRVGRENIMQGTKVRECDYLDLALKGGNERILCKILQNPLLAKRLNERWYGKDVKLRSPLMFLLLLPLAPLAPIWPLRSLVFVQEQGGKTPWWKRLLSGGGGNKGAAEQGAGDVESGSSRSIVSAASSGSTGSTGAQKEPGYWARVALLVSVPKLFFLFDCGCYVGLVITQSLVTIGEVYELPPHSSDAHEVLVNLSGLEIALWVFGVMHTIAQVFEMDFQSVPSGSGPGAYFLRLKRWATDVWNILDVVILTLLIVAYVFRFMNEAVWFRIFVAVGVFFAWLRMLEFVATANPPLGAMVNGFMATGGDVFYFVFVLLFVFFGYGLCSFALMHPHGRAFAHASDASGGFEPPYELFYYLFVRPSWNLFGELALDDYDEFEDVICDSGYDFYQLTARGFSMRPGLEKCLTKNIALVILMLYSLLVAVILVNLLVAVMSARWGDADFDAMKLFSRQYFERLDRYERNPPATFVGLLYLVTRSKRLAADSIRLAEDGLAQTKGAVTTMTTMTTTMAGSGGKNGSGDADSDGDGDGSAGGKGASRAGNGLLHRAASSRFGHLVLSGDQQELKHFLDEVREKYFSTEEAWSEKWRERRERGAGGTGDSGGGGGEGGAGAGAGTGAGGSSSMLESVQSVVRAELRLAVRSMEQFVRDEIRSALAGGGGRSSSGGGGGGGRIEAADGHQGYRYGYGDGEGEGDDGLEAKAAGLIQARVRGGQARARSQSPSQARRGQGQGLFRENAPSPIKTDADADADVRQSNKPKLTPRQKPKSPNAWRWSDSPRNGHTHRHGGGGGGGGSGGRNDGRNGGMRVSPHAALEPIRADSLVGTLQSVAGGTNAAAATDTDTGTDNGAQTHLPARPPPPAGPAPSRRGGTGSYSGSNTLALTPSPNSTATAGTADLISSKYLPAEGTPAERLEAARRAGHLKLLATSPEFRDMI